jgi:diguanylate cyclase (GGDEF)-like protein
VDASAVQQGDALNRGLAMSKAEQELSSVLSEFARTMLTDFPIQAILEHLVKRIVDVLPITGAGVTLIEPPLSPRFVAATDRSAFLFEELQTELGEGPCLAAYQSGEPVLVPDLRREDRFEEFRPRALEIGLEAVFTFPLRHGNRLLGALDLFRDEPGAFTVGEADSAQTLADVTSAYLVNAQVRSDLQDSSNRTQERPLRDTLTGLPNRILLLERIEHAIVRSGRSRKLVAVLFIDLDHFASINDKYGHQAGDELLITVGERIAGILRPADTLSHLPGDEFVILCEELDEVPQVEIVATRVVDALGTPFVIANSQVNISASVGIAFAGQANHNPEQLLYSAEIAMHQVKRKGGANHQIIDLSSHHLADYHTDLRIALSKAEERGELRVDYQPIVRTDDGSFEGFEALLRWDHPTRGTIPPTTTIPLAEQSGLIIELGRWVLEQACFDRMRDHYSNKDLKMSVNVSARQLMAPDFVAMINTILADTGTEPKLLTLEITEGALVRDTQRAHIVLDELKELGLSIALDDFGTGYSSLSYLKQFPVDVVKIDQSFITDLPWDRSSYAIVSKTIELAHLLDLAVVCEGVETSEQHQAVAELACDFCQGFLFGRPGRISNLAGPSMPIMSSEPVKQWLGTG